VRATYADLVATTDLREAVFEAIRARTRGDVVPHPALETINATASAAPLVVGLDTTGRGLRWQQRPTVRAALSAVARDAIALLAGPMADRVRECANPECEIVFVDTSPPGARRWCAMGRCGNLVKNRDYRRRQPAEHRGRALGCRAWLPTYPGKRTERDCDQRKSIPKMSDSCAMVVAAST
jgi:predicted RNA-binding Zn ribbon-like protein